MKNITIRKEQEKFILDSEVKTSNRVQTDTITVDTVEELESLVKQHLNNLSNKIKEIDFTIKSIPKLIEVKENYQKEFQNLKEQFEKL